MLPVNLLSQPPACRGWWSSSTGQWTKHENRPHPSDRTGTNVDLDKETWDSISTLLEWISNTWNGFMVVYVCTNGHIRGAVSLQEAVEVVPDLRDPVYDLHQLRCPWSAADLHLDQLPPQKPAQETFYRLHVVSTQHPSVTEITLC